MDEAAGREQSFISVSLSCSLAPVFVFLFCFAFPVITHNYHNVAARGKNKQER